MRTLLLVAVLALSFYLLFFAVDVLPATVPVALALALLELTKWRGARSVVGASVLSRGFAGHGMVGGKRTSGCRRTTQ